MKVNRMLGAAAAVVAVLGGAAAPAYAARGGGSGDVNTGVAVVGSCAYELAPCVTSVGVGSYRYVPASGPEVTIYPAATGLLPGFTTTGGRRPTYYVVGLGTRA